MGNFSGALNANEIFAALYNMIISQQVFADNIKGTSSTLVDRARVEGSMYGDTKLFYATDVLKSAAWGNDAEAANLLALHRPDAPEVQAITIDKFRQIKLTVDNYLSKRAWSTEGAFSEFNSVMLAWLRDTKKVYDATLYNSYIGTAESAAPMAEVKVTLESGKEAQSIAEALADLFVELEDISREYNDYENLRSYDEDDLIVVANSKWVNKITKMDLPTIYHKDGLLDKLTENVLPKRYFGTVNASAGTTSVKNTTVRSLVEKDYGTKHVFPGDLLPGSTAYLAGETYTEDANIICKVMHKNSVPFMSAFEVGTSFFNPASLTETHYLTFGHNTLEYLKDKPFITVKVDTE